MRTILFGLLCACLLGCGKSEKTHYFGGTSVSDGDVERTAKKHGVSKAEAVVIERNIAEFKAAQRMYEAGKK